jgi:hypothetical protein
VAAGGDLQHPADVHHERARHREGVGPAVEVGLLPAERGGERTQDLAGDPQHLGLPAQDDLAQLGQGGRPLVRADQPQPVRLPGTGLDGGALGPMSICSRRSAVPPVCSVPARV